MMSPELYEKYLPYALALGTEPAIPFVAGMPLDENVDEADFIGGYFGEPIEVARVALFLAEYDAADRVGEGGGAEGEFEAITVHEIGLDALRAMVLAGELTDAKTLVLAQALMLRRGELFL